MAKYKKHGTGVNDHRKGNRTTGPDRINSGCEVLADNTARYKNEIDQYKKFAAARRSRRKYKQENAGVMYEQIKEYAAQCIDDRQPMTIAGMMLATGTNKDFWSKAQNNEYDYLLEEYISLHRITADNITEIDGLPYHLTTDDDGEIAAVLLLPYSEILEKSTILIQDQLERNLYTNKGNPAGSIFSLKAQFKWREEEPTTTYSSNTLIIADKDQAVKALEMLKPSNSNGSSGSGNNW